MAGFLRRDEGNAAIEFALVMPVFLLLLVGILFYGVYFGAAHSVQYVAAEAARAAIAGLTGAERESLARARAAVDIAADPLLDPRGASVAVEQPAGSIKVTVRYDPSYLPVWGLAGLVPAPSGPILRVGMIDAGGTP